MGVLPLSKYTFYKCHLSPAVNDPVIKWKRRMMMLTVVSLVPTSMALMVMVATVKMGTPPAPNFILL